MKRLSVEEKVARRRQRKIRGMVYTVARKCHDADLASNIPLHLHHDYVRDAAIEAIVSELFDDDGVPNIRIPAMAFKRYADGYKPATLT